MFQNFSAGSSCDPAMLHRLALHLLAKGTCWRPSKQNAEEHASCCPQVPIVFALRLSQAVVVTVIICRRMHAGLGMSAVSSFCSV